ncbi:MAG: hypothetical protein ACFFCV_11565 [Promethearchaeota archaeon]
MKEITHKGLARLVGLYGFHSIDSNNLEILVSSSVEPDLINREEMGKGISKALLTSIGWFVDHTDKAKELAIQNIKKAIEAYDSGDSSWSRWLGWAFHFITDWATPYHSSIALSKYIADPESDIFKKESESEGVSYWTILGKVLKSFQFKVDHDEFEEICEERWQQSTSLIIDNFIKFKEKNTLIVDIELFSEKMDKLRTNCKNKLLEWIKVCSNQEFSLYMVDIAKVMDISCQLVVG